MAQAETDVAGEGLRGRVKMVTQTEYTNKAMKNAFMKTVDKYDRKGNLTETINDSYLLKLHSRKYMRYDTNASGLTTTRHEYDDKNAEVRRVNYTYDGNHLTAEDDHRYYDGKDVVYRSEHMYDSAGTEMQLLTYTNGILNERTTYTYDKRGRLTTTKVCDSSGKQLRELDYSYYAGPDWVGLEKHEQDVRTHMFRIIDTAGLIVEKTAYVADYSHQTDETSLTFDKQGNWLTKTVKGTITDNLYMVRSIEYYAEIMPQQTAPIKKRPAANKVNAKKKRQ